jgi:hypothetical protein
MGHIRPKNWRKIVLPRYRKQIRALHVLRQADRDVRRPMHRTHKKLQSEIATCKCELRTGQFARPASRLRARPADSQNTIVSNGVWCDPPKRVSTRVVSWKTSDRRRHGLHGENRTLTRRANQMQIRIIAKGPLRKPVAGFVLMISADADEGAPGRRETGTR